MKRKVRRQQKIAVWKAVRVGFIEIVGMVTAIKWFARLPLDAGGYRDGSLVEAQTDCI